MPTLADFNASLTELCSDLYEWRHSSRPTGWRQGSDSLDNVKTLRKRCKVAIDNCLATIEAVAGEFPAEWIGNDPQTSKYCRLRRALNTMHFWITEVQGQNRRGFKMPMNSDDQDQNDDQVDVKSWGDAEGEVRKLCKELTPWIHLRNATEAISSQKRLIAAEHNTEPPAPSGETKAVGPPVPNVHQTNYFFGGHPNVAAHDQHSRPSKEKENWFARLAVTKLVGVCAAVLLAIALAVAGWWLNRHGIDLKGP